MLPVASYSLIAKLTPRQMQIAELLIEGRTNREIATILSISGSAIKRHIERMKQKTCSENRIQFIVLFARWKSVNEYE